MTLAAGMGVIFWDPDATNGMKITTINFRFGEYFGCLLSRGQKSIPDCDIFPWILLQLSASTHPTAKCRAEVTCFTHCFTVSRDVKRAPSRQPFWDGEVNVSPPAVR